MNCRMDGWNQEHAAKSAPTDPEYSYVPKNEIEPYWQMAKQYVLGDKAFASNLDGSFVAHQYIVAAYSRPRSISPILSGGAVQGGNADRSRR